MRWDPQQYGRFADERSRPFFDLTSRITAESPGVVVDLGCGSGELTATLSQRWPQALVTGVDSSAEMLAKAPPGLTTWQQDAAHFEATGVDVLVSNAALQWVPAHRALLPRWLEELNPGGTLAFQVPDNFRSPSHALMREVAESPRWRDRLDGVLRHDDAVASLDEYAASLGAAGARVDAWRTTYLHVLPGPDPVLEWVRGTGLRPVLAALGDDAPAFEAEYGARLRLAYPRQPWGTPFPFDRIFVVCVR